MDSSDSWNGQTGLFRPVIPLPNRSLRLVDRFKVAEPNLVQPYGARSIRADDAPDIVGAVIDMAVDALFRSERAEAEQAVGHAPRKGASVSRFATVRKILGVSDT